MKYYKVTNRSKTHSRVPGSAEIMLAPKETQVLSARDFSLSLIKLNKLFNVEEIIVASTPSTDIESNKPRTLRKGKARVTADKKPAESSISKTEKVSEDG